MAGGKAGDARRRPPERDQRCGGGSGLEAGRRGHGVGDRCGRPDPGRDELGPHGHDQGAPAAQRRRQVHGDAFELGHVGAGGGAVVGPHDEGEVVACELVAEALRGRMGVDRLSGQERPHGLGPQRGSAAHPALALLGVLGDEGAG